MLGGGGLISAQNAPSTSGPSSFAQGSLEETDVEVRLESVSILQGHHPIHQNIHKQRSPRKLHNFWAILSHVDAQGLRIFQRNNCESVWPGMAGLLHSDDDCRKHDLPSESQTRPRQSQLPPRSIRRVVGFESCIQRGTGIACPGPCVVGR